MELRAPLLDAGGLYLTGEDHLRLTTFGGVANLVVVLEGRLVTPAGLVVPLAEQQIPLSTYLAKSTIFPLAEGVLTNVQLRLGTGSAGRGGVFGVLEIVRGLTSNAQALGTLLQGYITSNARLAWPGSPIESSVNGPGRLRSITGTNPAANVEISETVPAGVRWRIYSFVFSLTTDANVANRDVNLIIDDGANEIWKAGGSATQVASVTRTYYGAAAGFSPAVLTSGVTVPLPEALYLSSGYRIRTATNARQAGDDFTAPQYLVEEWIE